MLRCIKIKTVECAAAAEVCCRATTSKSMRLVLLKGVEKNVDLYKHSIFLKKNKVYFISEYRAESRCFKIISPQIVVCLAKR
jgi:hypothetical protein